MVNCTGFLGDLDQAGDPLLRRLLAAGLIRPDPCRLGADVDAASRLIGTGGQPQAGLYAVGPLTRGALWEITAVPEIRAQTEQVAERALAVARRRAAA